MKISSKLLALLSLSLCFGLCGVAEVRAAEPKEQQLQVNEQGETYGNAIFSQGDPDLVEALSTNGSKGYVKQADLDGNMPSSPAEAAENNTVEKRIVPVYENDGITMIGEFIISNEEIGSPIQTRGTATSSKMEFQVNGKNFYNQASVELVNLSNNKYVQSRIKIMANETIPAGWLGCSPKLHNSAGTLIKSADYTYNSSSLVGMEVPVTYFTTAGTYYANGRTHTWNSSTNAYAQYFTYDSPRQGF